MPTSKISRRRKPGRPRGAEGPDLKQALLTAAIDLFAERGFDGVSLSQIAGKADADIALTRYYFGSKDQLWEAAMTLLAERFAAEITGAVSELEESQEDALKNTIRAFVLASARWPQVSRIIVFDGNKEDQRGVFIAKHMVTPFYRILSELIARAVSQGSIPNVSPRTIFFMITHGGSFPMALPALTNALPGEDINSTKGLNAHAEAIIALLFGSMK